MAIHSIFPAINILILGLLSFLYLKKPVSKWFKKRSEMFSKKRREAGLLHKNAENINNEYNGKLKNINKEMADIIKTAESDGEKAGYNLIRDTEKRIDEMIESAMEQSDNETRRKKREHFACIIDQSIDEARKNLINSLEIEGDIIFIKKYLEKLKEITI